MSLPREVESGFNVWYLDDATLGSSSDVVLRDVRQLVSNMGAIGLEVNNAKCELTVLGQADVDLLLMQITAVIPACQAELERDRLVFATP